MQGKFSGLTNYLAKNIVDPGKHNENETLLSDNHMMHIEDRPGRVIHDMIQKSEARLDLHLKTMQEELAQQLLASFETTFAQNSFALWSNDGVVDGKTKE